MKLKKLKKTNHSKVLLILTPNPLTRHIHKWFGVNTTYKDWKIIYWNFLPFLNKKLDNIYSGKGNRLLKDKNYIKICSVSDLIKEYKKIPNKFFYINLLGNFTSLSLLDRILHFSGGTKIVVETGRPPEFKIKYSKIIRNLINNKIYLIVKILNYIYSKIGDFIRIKMQANADIFFAGSYETYLDFKKKYKNKKIFKINSHEFDLFLESKKNKSIGKKNILFIDQAINESFDYKLNYIKNIKMPKNNYWKDMNSFFDAIIKKYPNNKFVVAAHHRRNKNDISIKKKFVFDKTCELIKDSVLVLAHESAAINFAVLFRKPIVFITTNFLETYYDYNTMHTYWLSKKLGTQVININKNFILNNKIPKTIKSAKVDKKKYERFENYYIGFPGLRSYGSWNTILKHLDNY